MHHKYASQNLITILLCSNKQFLVTIAKYNYMYKPMIKIQSIKVHNSFTPTLSTTFFKANHTKYIY